MPYLIGPNSVAITPNMNSVTNMIGIECSQKPTTPSAETAISTSFTLRATTDLSNRSAIWPPSPDRKKNGPMNTAAVSVISASRFGNAGGEQDEEDQRVLEEVVVEGGEELAPEQRGEAPGRHQGIGHR